MSDELKNIMQEQTCLTRNEMQDYIAGRLAGNRLRRVELHLADCELCSEAVDGLRLLTETETNESLIKIDNRISNRLKETPVLIILMKRAMAVAAVLVVVIIGAFFLNEFMNQKHHEVAQNISGEKNDEKIPQLNSITKEDSPTTGTIKFTPPVEDLKQNQKPDEQPDLNKNYKGTISTKNISQEEVTTISSGGYIVMDDATAPAPVEEKYFDLKNSESLDGDKITDKNANEFSPLEKDNVVRTETGVTIQATSPSYSYSSGAPPQYSAPLQLDEVQIVSGKKNKTGKEKIPTAGLTKSEDQSLADSVSVDVPSDLFNHAMQYKSTGEKEKAIVKLDELIKLNNELKPQAMWEKALLLIDLNKKDKAKTVLTDLSKIESAYKQQAIDKLKELQ